MCLLGNNIWIYYMPVHKWTLCMSDVILLAKCKLFVELWTTTPLRLEMFSLNHRISFHQNLTIKYLVHWAETEKIETLEILFKFFHYASLFV